jgi:transcriptional regulator with PAS, ATPase and Fis domain
MGRDFSMQPQADVARHVLIGQSTRMRNVQRLIEKVGKHRWPVLLLGETGTGKEVVAREIHRQNPVGPFVPIDCSALVGPLMESELFGHAKGSFTGAVATKTGLIEVANGGVAFLDEIGELPLDLQVKLLRVLQEREFRPVGAVQTRKSDFRAIAATNRDLAKEVEKGTFRRDLYYRLNVVSVRLAPLRERKDDIPALVAHFIFRYGRSHTVTQEVLEALIGYEWPGNVRELENCVQHMVAVNSGPLLHFSDLPSPIQNAVRSQRGMAAAAAAGVASQQDRTEPLAQPRPPAFDAFPRPYGDSASGLRLNGNGSANGHPIRPLMEVERRAIMEALEYTKGDRAVAAHLLGIGRTTLYRKLKEYELAG